MSYTLRAYQIHYHPMQRYIEKIISLKLCSKIVPNASKLFGRPHHLFAPPPPINDERVDHHSFVLPNGVE